MAYYYTALQSKSHAFILEQRMRLQGIKCELVYMPRVIMKDICNLGVRFEDRCFSKAVDVIKNSGLPGCKIYLETVCPNSSQYTEIQFQ